MSLKAHWRIPLWFPELEKEKAELLHSYHAELLKWTQKINLISPNTTMDSDFVHVADGILGAQKIIDNISTEKIVWDLGSGNGIPGLVFAILYPTARIQCLDSDDRKVSFIKNTALKLGLKNVGATTSRVEETPQNTIEVAIARGFAPVSRALELVGKALMTGGQFFHFKGPEWKNELDLQNLEKCSTWNISEISRYEIPQNGGIRTIIRSVKN